MTYKYEVFTSGLRPSILWKILIALHSISSCEGIEASKFLEEMNCERLLEDGVCLEKGYQNTKVPEKGNTTIKVTFLQQKVRALNDKDKTIAIDFQVAFQWIDSRIKSRFTEKDVRNGGIGLDLKQTFFAIWKPDLYIYNLTDYKVIWSDQIRLGGLKVASSSLSTYKDNPIEWKVEASAQVLCNLDLYNYPMDNQTCELRLGSQSPNYEFVLYHFNNVCHRTYPEENDDYQMKISFFEKQSVNEGLHQGLGFKIEIKRKLKAFILRYYLPTAAIVLASQISFIIPIDAIPGRIALVVTMFLTLTNIFIHQMVGKNYQSISSNVVTIKVLRYINAFVFIIHRIILNTGR